MYLSKTLADNLFVLQYPTKKIDADPNESMVLRTSVKPMNQEIKIAYKLDTASRHYDAFKGEQLAIAADGKVYILYSKSRFNLQLFSSIGFP